MSSTTPTGGRSMSPEVTDRLLAYHERTTDLVGVADDQGRVVYLNDTARERLHIPLGAEEALTTDVLFPEEAFDIYFEQIRPAIVRGEVWSGFFPVRVGGGDVVEMWATILGEARAGGEVAWLVISARDVTEWRHVREELSREATHDPLTGLANRTLMLDRLDIALARARRTDGVVGVLFVDVDDLKVVNDAFGHHAGDAVLVEISHRLRDAVRAIDTVARVGGDEFVVVLDGVDDEEGARALAVRVDAVLGAQAISVGPDTAVNVSSSIGIAVGDGSADAEHLLRSADAAMYELKGERHPDRRPVDPSVPRIVPAITAHDVAVALTQRSIVPWYQPVVTAEGRELAVLHSLARWLRPGADPVPAAEFVEVVDASAVGFSLDLAMLRHAASDLASWPGLGAIRVDVPVGPRFLLRNGVERFVAEVSARAHLPAERIGLVVPERLLATSSRLVADALWAVRELGVVLVANVPVLAPGELPQLEDGIFTELRFPASADVGAVLEFAQRRGMRSRAFGVERDEQLDEVTRLGCDLVEGLRIGAPRPVPDRGASLR